MTHVSPQVAVTAFLAAVAILALAERLLKSGSLPPPPSLSSKSAPLYDAAAEAWDYLSLRRLPLAFVALRTAPGAQIDWIANNMLKTRPIAAVSVATGREEILGRFDRAKLVVTADGLAYSSGGDPVYVSPTISDRDFRLYLRWARKVW